MMRKLVSPLIIIVLLLPVNALAEKLVFAVATGVQPYTIVEKGKITGMNVEIVLEACKRLGIEAELMPLSWARALKIIKKGGADAIFSGYRTKERTQFLYYPSEPINSLRVIIFAREGSETKVTRLEELKGKTVGLLRKYSYGEKFDKYQGVKRQLYNSVDELIKVLAKGRTDLIVAHEGIFRYRCKQENLQDRFEAVYVISDEPLYVAFSKKALGEKGSALAEKFSGALQQMKKEGLVQKIMERYQ
ncbi:transporter substrate-binding domain-containing protein [Desulfobacterales bacterium HSG2]|nr:transporter substrate-binding domain-containing protein [Desulfobacterales bacterium HSG2]